MPGGIGVALAAALIMASFTGVHLHADVHRRSALDALDGVGASLPPSFAPLLGRVLRLRGGKKVKPWDEAYARGGGGISHVPVPAAVAGEGSVLVDWDGGRPEVQKREVMLAKLASRQSCTALDPSRIAGGDKAMENYVDWTRNKKSTDEELGITEYIHRGAGSGGLIKARWADFRVQEICIGTRQAVKLENAVAIPPRPWPLAVEGHHAESARAPLSRSLGKLPASKLVDHALSLAASLTRNFTQATVGGTLVLALKPNSRGIDAVRVCDEFWPFISAQVETDRNDFARSVLVIRVNAKWARAHKLSYLNSSLCMENATMRFTLTKAGWDTMGVLDRLADAIKCNRRCFTVAGLKDKSGVTEQHVTASLSPKAVLKGASCIPGVLVGDFEVVPRSLRLGEQLGNKFSVLVRHLTGTEEDTTAAIKSLMRNGFVNYFGHQRFGNSAASMMPSVEVGKLISKGLWREGVMCALREPTSSCSPDEKQAKRLFSQKGDIEGALRLMPRYCNDERVLLEALSLKKGHQAAMESMPHCRMFQQAYWSKVWNRCATQRIKLYGTATPVVGDIVLLSGESAGGGRVMTSHLSAFQLAGGRSMTRFGEGGEGEGGCAPELHEVTAKDVKEGRFDIFQVVLPMPDASTSMVYPGNGVKTFLKKILKEDGMYSIVRAARGSKQRCSFRYLLGKPTDVAWRFLRYRDRETGMTFELSSCDSGREGGDGPFRSLLLGMTLEPGMFCTMALREVTGETTHPSDQFRLRLRLEADEDELTGKKWQGKLKRLMDERGGVEGANAKVWTGEGAGGGGSRERAEGSGGQYSSGSTGNVRERVASQTCNAKVAVEKSSRKRKRGDGARERRKMRRAEK